jgi:hypothetical protein
MTPKDIIRERIDLLSGADCIYTKQVTEILNVEIKPDNLTDLDNLINIYEMHEEAIKDIRRALTLKQNTFLMSYMATYAKNLNSAA